MTTRAEAREHIESFWARRGLSRSALGIEGNLNLRDLSKSLNILSEALYTDTTRFIWELFQNADDSKYAAGATTPCVDLILMDHSLIFKTNEIGFTRDDVESLCAIGLSSKAGQNDTIGEKGIGFKSVFRVAEVVSIHSGVYAFQLSIRPPYGNLGMVLPVWLDKESDFPGTSITLQLKAGIDHCNLRSQLSSFDFSFLLFSQKIKMIKLDVSVERPVKTTGKLIHLGENSFKIETMVSGSPSTTMEYFTLRYPFPGMPPRPGVQDQSSGTETFVMFAFPHHNYQPALQSQKTFAFLPIASFGFQFLIHADFVLIANRQDIQNEIPWNISLQARMPEVLCRAFETLAKSKMRYSWPKYLDCLRSIHNPYMRTIADETLSALGSRPLVEMELSNTTFCAPRDSLRASRKFRTTSGKLLITSGTRALQVMSGAYSATNSDVALVGLGVTHFTISEFIEQLRNCTSSEFADFSSEWHSRVAEVLLRQSTLREFTAIKALKVIPLNDGSWASGSSDDIFLNDDSWASGSSDDLPAGLNFRFVKATAAADPYRRRLYAWLGVKTCDETEISRKIVKYHATSCSGSSVEDLRSHAVYVFRAGYRPLSGLHLRLVDSNSTPRYDDRVHLPFGRIGSTVRGLFADDFHGIVWLHPDYETMVTDREKRDWIQFLYSLVGVYKWPPVVSGGRLSDAMRHILERNRSKKFLAFLKMQDSFEFGSNLGFTQARIQTTNDIKNLEVLTDRGTRKLCETILPSLSDPSLGLLPVLQLDGPIDADWDFLSNFGVLTNLSPIFHVEQVRSLKASNDKNRAKEMAKPIYSAIAAYPYLEVSELTSFQTENLIYVDPGRWLSPDQCVWRASFRCTQVPILSKIYSGCDNLFQTLLRVRDAGLDDLIAELVGLESSDDLKRAKVLRTNMLPALNYFLSKASPSESQRRYLASARIFPVTQIDASSSVSTTFCQSGENFWIADMNWLKLKFEGLLPLLDVAGDLFKRPMDNIFKVLSMDHKRLSKSVKTEQQVRNDGVSRYDRALTDRLQRQSRYIIGIASKAGTVSPRLEEVRTKLSSVQVFRVQNITIKRFVFGDDDIKIYGRDDQGNVHLEDTEAELRVNIRQGIDILDAIVPLTDSLAEYLNLGDSHRELLSKVLTTERADQFMESLERAGVKIAPNTAVQDEAEAGFDEDSDDATLAEDPDEDLESAFGRLQIDGARHLRTPDSRSGETRPQGRSTTPAAQSLAWRYSTKINSATRMSTPTNASSSRAELTATSARRPTFRTEPIESLTARLSSATLSDSTADVLHRNFMAPAAETAGSRGSEGSIIGSTNFSSLNLDSAALEAHSDNRGVGVSNSRRTSSTNRRISSDNTARFTFNSNAVQPSSGEVDVGPETPTRTARQVSTGRSFRSSYEDNSIMTQESSGDTPHEIGFVGEHLVYKFFEKKLSPLFTYKSWTSRNRNKVFPDHSFRNGLLERDFADFTYVDTDGKLGQYLSETIPGFERPTGQSNITYHLEVKTTLAGLETAALLSNNQISLAKMYSRRFSTSAPPGTHVYMLVRVYGLGSDPPRPQFCLFPDPWALIYEGLLQIEGDNGIYVWPNSSEPLGRCTVTPGVSGTVSTASAEPSLQVPSVSLLHFHQRDYRYAQTIKQVLQRGTCGSTGDQKSVSPNPDSF